MNKNKILLIVIGVLLILTSILGISYAIYKVNLSGNNNIVKASCFNVSISEENNIALKKAYPLTNKEGKELTPYKLVVTNNCDSAISYQVNLEILNTSTLTNMDYIKVMFKDLEPELVSSYDKTNTTLTNASSAYKLENGYMDKNEKREFNIRIWLDEDVTTETEGVQNKSFKSKVTVTAVYKDNIPTKATEYITELANTDDSLVYDETSDNNLRYIGSDPNNYVSIDGELWRIIGVMNNIDDGIGTKETRIKLIRNESIGGYSWDTSDASINGGMGINEWSQSTAMKLLNPGYENESVGGSLYWNNESGNCYNGSSDATRNCDFSSNGMKNILKNLIGDVLWNTGSNGDYDYDKILYPQLYVTERENKGGKICTSGDYCNDIVQRTTKWLGKVGLFYASDYGYASLLGDNYDSCMNTSVISWNNSSICSTNNWLNTAISTFTITPCTFADRSNRVFRVYDGAPDTQNASNARAIRPSVYLSSSVRIISGDGTKDNAYVLGM